MDDDYTELEIGEPLQLDASSLSALNEEVVKARLRLGRYNKAVYAAQTNKGQIDQVDKLKGELRRSYRALTYLLDNLQEPVMDILTAIHRIVGDD